MTTTTKTIRVYLGDGINLIMDGNNLSLSGSRIGERPITMRPAIFKRLMREGINHLSASRKKTAALPLLARLVERALPEDGFEDTIPPTDWRTIPLLVVSKTRDEEMAEWELTLRRKRESQAKPRPEGPGAPPAKKRPLSEFA